MALLTLRDIYKNKGEEFIKGLFKSYVIVSEQIDGSRFIFQKKPDDSITFYRKTGVEINYIDRTIMSFYEKGIEHISSLEKAVLDKIPDNWTFGFKYFPSLAPINIVYDRMPKNNLVLTDISIRNESGRVVKVINDTRVLRDWASILEVENPPIIYEGYLTDVQKDKIHKFLNTNEQELESLFKSKSFTRYIISILNPNLKTTALCNSLDKDIEGIVFKFIKPGESEFFSAKIVDPIIAHNNLNIKSKKRRVSDDMYQIAMLDIVEFMEQYKFKDAILTSDTQEERYIELMSEIFNEYVATHGHKYAGVDFNIPDFAKNPEFNINTKNIKNSRTKEIIDNEYMHDLFKIILSSFRKHRKKPTDILTKTVVSSINSTVNKIEKIIMSKHDENIALDFNSLMSKKKYSGEVSIFEDVQVVEALTINHPEQGLKKVNIVAGRYQPFTKGHIKVFEQLYKQNGYPVIACIVRGSKPNPEKNPFDVDLQLKMFGSLTKQFRFLESAVVIPTAGIDVIFNAIRPAYEPALWGAGSDRVKAYQNQINRYGDELNVLEEFKVHETKRTDGDVSATKVRQSLVIEDEESFKKYTPKSIHKYYHELKEVMGVHESHESTSNSTEVINESYSKHQENWKDEYTKFAKRTLKIRPDTIKPPRRKEVLRAEFGDNITGEAENNLNKFLLTHLRLKNKKDYELFNIAPSEYLSDIKKDLSGTYHGFRILFKRDVKILGTEYSKGDNIYITNRYLISNSGRAVIKKKDLTPDALGITGKEYHTARALYSDIQVYVNKSDLPERYKTFLLETCELIMNDNGNSNSYNTFEEYADSGKIIVYNCPEGHFTGIDSISIANFQVDFGEALGSLMLFNILKNTGEGSLYPTASNEALVDFYFDEYKVSSKAGSGATPSGTSAIKLIQDAYNKNDITLEGKELEFYENVVKPWLNPNKLGSSSIYNAVIHLASINLDSDSGFNLILDESGFKSNTMTRELLIKWLDEKMQSQDALSFLEEFVKRSTSNIKNLPKYIERYIKQIEGNDSNRIGLIFYPILAEVSKALTNKYSNELTTILQKLTNIKQVYMNTRIKKDSIEFKTKQFKNSNFIFQPKGSVPNPFNAMIGTKLV